MMRIAILGGGPSALFMYKRFTETACTELEITIFEKTNQLGAGMPYSANGANTEHITNVSGNEIPQIVTPVAEWIRTQHRDTLNKFNIDPEKFNDYKTLPRLLFGQYLADQFKLLQQRASQLGINTQILYKSEVTDVIDEPDKGKVTVQINNNQKQLFDRVIICTGHLWPRTHEGSIAGYFDSPYPPAKLAFDANHAVALRGSSLTAIDAIRTLARCNGSFEADAKGRLSYHKNAHVPAFKIVMHSRNGLLPALRFHLDDSHLGKNTILSAQEVAQLRAANDGFLPLDYVFERNFKESLRSKDPDFYQHIKDMRMEEFVDDVMALREKLDAFTLLAAEFAEAEKSIKRRQSIYWKEMLGVLSFVMNYPAKYFSAEDRLRLQRVLMPLISIVIAYVPQSSADEMLAMHKAGCLDIVAVGDDSLVEPVPEGGIIYHYRTEDGKAFSVPYKTFVDCIGQPALSFDELPYPSLLKYNIVSRAKLYFKDAAAGKAEHAADNTKVGQDAQGRYYLLVPGIAINDSFQVVDEYNSLNERIYVMAVPFISGYNPDYSGLDFGEAASAAIISSINQNSLLNNQTTRQANVQA